MNELLKSEQLDQFNSLLKNGKLLMGKGMLVEALIAFTNASRVFPASGEALYSIAKIHQQMGKFQDALDTLIRLIKLQGELTPLSVRSMALELSKKIARWDVHEIEYNYIKKHLNEENSLPPFVALSEPFSNEELFKNVQIANRNNPDYTPKPTYYSFSDRTFENRKIRLGFMSADFKYHPVSYVISGLFENLDKEKFEVFLYDLDIKSPKDNERKKRVQTNGIFYAYVGSLKPKELADTVYNDKIDILVDLNGFTSENKLPTLTYRPAPVQATFLGYSGTIGKIPGVDYIICDQYILPPSEQKYYGEKFAYLPCYFTYDTKDSINPALYERKNFDLPEEAVVLACFCNDYKYTLEYINIWLNVLKNVPQTVLWIFSKTPSFEKNLLDYAQTRGIDKKRIIFAHYLPSHADHLARYRCADLFLDTQYYNAHTTAAETLFAGCPLITCPGQTFASRVSGSILTALDMKEMICSNSKEYENKITELTSHPEKLKQLRQKLEENKKKTKFFDNRYYAEKFGELCIDLLNKYSKK